MARPKHRIALDPDALIITWRSLAAQHSRGSERDRLLRLADQLQTMLDNGQATFGAWRDRMVRCSNAASTWDSGH